MDLKSIFQRKPGRAAAPSADAPGDVVQQARVRARRRLMGAVVLVVIGVIGFPLLFETQPRPIPVDIPIIVPRRDSAPALTMPAPRPSRQAAAAQRAASDTEEVV
jgi:DedD protein